MNPYEELKKRALPPLRSREEMKEILQREVYGYLPTCPCEIIVSEPTSVEARFALGTVCQSYVTMTLSIGGRAHAFRVDRMLHTDGKKRPLVIVANLHPMTSSQYFPREEMSEYDADYLLFCYKDVSSDDGDFENGLAPLLLPYGQNTDTACGKIGIWAYAAMRVLDYGLTLDGTDAKNVAIVGHSRLGKTALFTGMMDERFRFVFSNAAGCAGDALAHGNSGHTREPHVYKLGELYEDIYGNFPFWFCKNFKRYTEKNLSEDFDQHYLLATIAPRCVLVGSCSEDLWADPISQQLCALAAGEAWEAKGLSGLVGCDRILDPEEELLDGNVGFFKIRSLHFLSRHCWRRFMCFLEKHKR